MRGKAAMCHGEDVCQVTLVDLFRRDLFARVSSKKACLEKNSLFSRLPLLGNNVLAVMHSHCSFLFSCTQEIILPSV